MGFEFLSILAPVLSSIATSNRKSVFFPVTVSGVFGSRFSNFWLCYDLVSVSVSVVYAQHLAYPHSVFLEGAGLSFFCVVLFSRRFSLIRKFCL